MSSFNGFKFIACTTFGATLFFGIVSGGVKNALAHGERERVQANLEFIQKQSYLVRTRPELAVYLPHLNESQIDTLLDQFKSSNLIEVAYPAVSIAYSYHLIQLIPNRVQRQPDLPESNRKLEAIESITISYSRHVRTEDSFEPRIAGIPAPEAVFGVRAAISYARTFYPSSLFRDKSKSILVLHIEDPHFHHESGRGCEEKSTVYTVLSRDLDRILEAPRRGRGEVRLEDMIDRSIMAFTLNPVEGSELTSFGNDYHFRNCAQCYSGLGPDQCVTCGVSFPRNNQVFSWCLRLPNQIAAHLDSLKKESYHADADDEASEIFHFEPPENTLSTGDTLTGQTAN